MFSNDLIRALSSHSNPLQNVYAKRQPLLQSPHNTTIVGLQYDEGVLLGADCRITTDDYVINPFGNKLIHVTGCVFCARSGNECDTQDVMRKVQTNVDLFKSSYSYEWSVSAVAHLYHRITCDMSANHEFAAGLIIGGWDAKNGFELYEVPCNRSCRKVPYSTHGSGSDSCLSMLDSHYQDGMNRADCRRLVIEAITSAIRRDESTGGCVRLVDITRSNYRRELVDHNDLPRLSADLL